MERAGSHMGVELNTALLSTGKYNVTVYGKEHIHEHLVLTVEARDEGLAVWEECVRCGYQNFALACIGGVDWEDDLSPWKAPAAFRKAPDFGGGADAFLKTVTEDIMTLICGERKPDRVSIAGYSLAGLFAVYACFCTDCFDSFASVSGSLWFPDLLEFIMSNRISAHTEKAYFSVGDKEANTKNQAMRKVDKNTRAICEQLSAQGVRTVFELNSGGHFTDDVPRLAKGICSILAKE